MVRRGGCLLAVPFGGATEGWEVAVVVALGVARLVRGMPGGGGGAMGGFGGVRRGRMTYDPSAAITGVTPTLLFRGVLHRQRHNRAAVQYGLGGIPGSSWSTHGCANRSMLRVTRASPSTIV